MLVELPWRAPEEVFRLWSDDPHVAFLDSGGEASARSRHSYLAVSPFRIVGASAGADPFLELARALARFAGEHEGPAPFGGGAVGFLGYELGARLERVPRAPAGAGLAFPDMVFGLYDLVFGFDHAERRAWLVSSGLPEPDPGRRGERARARAGWALARLDAPRAASEPPAALVWRAETSRDVHMARVERILQHIGAGDIYQANLTARFLGNARPGLQPAELFMRLRAASPAPFSAYLQCGPDLAIASASPERFLSVTANGRVEARPIKGTSRRGRTPADDERLRAELAASEKDRAENLMIVDLLRHDIGRVAGIGSVSVPEFCAVETFAAVHHLVSSVAGRLRAGLGPVDVLRAAFPGGSITGAPKIRAMEIIAAIEGVARGPYCGSVAWIGFDGAMDSSIVIRTVVVAGDRVVAQAGGGIVADSDPAAEFEEMMVKARPILRAVGTWTE